MPSEQLPLMEQPQWLSSIDQDNISSIKFLAIELLTNSLYYPSSGFDGDPIKHLYGHIHSFIYVDYGKSSVELELDINKFGFVGFRKIVEKAIDEKELVPLGWSVPKVEEKDGDFSVCLLNRKPFFCRWYVFEREEQITEGTVPQRFSLLYICQDGCIAYKTLFNENSIAPKAIAIIQPGHAFGLNWTDFTDTKSMLYRTVHENSAGFPEILMSGGYGPKKWYRQPCWSSFPKLIKFVNKSSNGNIGIWGQ